MIFRSALFAVALTASLSAAAQSGQWCTKMLTVNGPDQNVCYDADLKGPVPARPADPVVQPAPRPSVSLPNAQSSVAQSAAQTTIGGDSNKSMVAVFPAPSTAAVPVAHNCIATRSTAGGIGWNLIQGATSEQYSEPVCVLMWLLSKTYDATESANIRAEILKRLQ